MGPGCGTAAALALHAAINDVSGNAVIQLSPTDSITLVGVQTANLTASDFIITG